jgi:hypothetical protein
MPTSGKYDFKGIKKLGASGLRLALGSSPYLAWVLKFPSLSSFILEFMTNYLANKGLIILNIGAVHYLGPKDQKQFDEGIDQAIEKIRIKGGRDKLTPKEIEAIDNEVIKSVRPFIVFTRPK